MPLVRALPPLTPRRWADITWRRTSDLERKIMNGIVRRFSLEDKYGFIQPLIGKPDTTPDIFFHLSACRFGAAPPVGAEVRFKVVRGEKGIQCADIELVRIRMPRPEADRGLAL
jgi:cold shock CspA family protein